MENFISHLPILFVCAFFAILFLQSGLDKVLDYKGNLAYFKSQFANSIFAGIVPLLLPAITLLEVVTGIYAAWALVAGLTTQNTSGALYSPVLAGITLLCLFLGQRVAKDYAGAAGLVPYFIVALMGIWYMT